MMSMGGVPTPIRFPELKLLKTKVEDAAGISSLPASLEFPTWIICPALKILCLSVFYPLSLPGNRPSPIEELWIVGVLQAKPVLAHVSRNGFKSLETSCPFLERLTIDANIRFSPREVISLIKARKEGSEKGVEVGGVQMKVIQKLTIDLTELSSAEPSELEGLV